MANIGTLAVSLAADTKRFKKDMKNAREEVAGFRGIVDRMGWGVVARFTSIGAAAAAFTVVARNVSQASDEIDRMAKNARALDMTYQEMRKLDIMSRMLGLDVQKLNVAFRAMTQQRYQASHGMAESVRLWQSAGIDPRSLSGMDMASQLVAVATAVGRIDDSSTRFAVASRLLGESGGLLAGNAEGLAEAAERAEKAADGLSDAQVQAVERANDEWTRLWATVGSAWNQMAAATAEIRAFIYGTAADAFSESEYRKTSFEEIDAAIRYGSRDAIDPAILAEYDRMHFFDIMKGGSWGAVSDPISPLFSMSDPFQESTVDWAKASSSHYADAFEQALSGKLKQAEIMTTGFWDPMGRSIEEVLSSSLGNVENRLAMLDEERRAIEASVKPRLDAGVIQASEGFDIRGLMIGGGLGSTEQQQLSELERQTDKLEQIRMNLTRQVAVAGV